VRAALKNQVTYVYNDTVSVSEDSWHQMRSKDKCDERIRIWRKDLTAYFKVAPTILAFSTGEE
jgi:hypothetical protein